MEIVSFELAKKLKEKGFPQRPDYFNYSSYYDWDGLRKIHSLSNASVWFDPNISRDNIYFAPTISQVLKWLREEKKIHIMYPFYEDKGFYYYVQRIGNSARIVSSFDDSDTCFDTAEQAALTGIEYVIDNNLI